jgi:hypothetical protein
MLQNRQCRVHWSPKIMNVAVSFEKHSNMLGQLASWQTVCNLAPDSSRVTRA